MQNIFSLLFRSKAGLALPLAFQSPEIIEEVSRLGRHAQPFVERIKTLVATNPVLLTSESLALFIKADQHFDSVITAFELIYNTHPGFATIPTLELLVILGPQALDYAQHAAISCDNLQQLFPLPCELKEMRHLGALKLSTTYISHMIDKTEKDKNKALYAPEKHKKSPKKWASKMVAKLFIEQQPELLRRVGLLLNHTATHRYPTAPRSLPLEGLLLKDKITPQDIQDLNTEIYSAMIAAFDLNDNQTQAHTLLEVTEFLQDQENSALESSLAWCQAYRQSVAFVAEKIDYLKSLLTPGKMTQRHKTILKELQELALFPMKRATFLKESAEAQVEIVAQELRRALCPTDILGRNPFVKHRLATPNTSDSRKMQLLPQVPEMYIASEAIDFQDNISVQQLDGLDRVVFQSEPYFDESTQTEHQDRLPVSHIPGLGVVCFFAKFLGDSDAKISNIGVFVDRAHSSPYVFTALDSGACFSRTADTPAIFTTSHELHNNPHTDSDQPFNFFLSRFSKKPYFTYRNKKTVSFVSELLTLSQEPAMIQETFCTAFNMAFTPPDVYKIFVEQYLSMDNPFITQRYWSRIVKDHLLKEQQALYNLFQNDPALLDYFLTSCDSRNNIFHRYQQLIAQLESFCFYKKHYLKNLLKTTGHDNIITDYFLKMITDKFEKGDSMLRTQIQSAFEAWDPLNIEGISGLERLSFIEKGQELKAHIARLLGYQQNSQTLNFSGQQSAQALNTKPQASL